MSPTQAVAPVVLALRHEAAGYFEAASACDDRCVAALICEAFHAHCISLADLIERAATTGSPEPPDPTPSAVMPAGWELSAALHPAPGESYGS